MSDVLIRVEGVAGRITLNRPKALNALTWEMLLEIEAALDAWRGDDAVRVVVMDAAGDKAFCAGGDIAEMYATGKAGDFGYGQRFWRDEYRLNRKIYHYSKPVVSFLKGFTMGGGVGVGCHGSHRVVGESSQIAMPEVTIGLVPDVGGSLILAQAPGFLGEYLGTTGARMGPADAIYAGFADVFVPEDQWEDCKARLIKTGDVTTLENAAADPGTSPLAEARLDIDAIFGAEDVFAALNDAAGPVAEGAKKKISRNAPLALRVTVEMIRAVRADPSIENALDQEFRYTYRSAAYGDFIEGIRAAIIDRDRSPKWRHASVAAVPVDDVARMRADLGADALAWEE